MLDKIRPQESVEILRSERENFGESFSRDGLTVDLVKKYTEIYLLRQKLSKEDFAAEMAKRASVEMAQFVTEDEDAPLTKEAREYYKLSKGRFFSEHRHSLYLDSSDNIEGLAKVDVKGKKVLTVAASGDFAQIFINNGAAEVELFDVSIPGVLFNELKMVCLRCVSLENFKKMFVPEVSSSRWFDAEVYQEVRSLISQQGQIFFDAIVANLEDETSLTKDEVFSRSRKGFFAQGRKAAFIDEETDEGSYKELQNKAKKTPIKISWHSITNFWVRGLKKVDLVYLSNIGYEPEATMNFAACCLRRGAKEVMFSLGHRRVSFIESSTSPNDDLHGYKIGSPEILFCPKNSHLFAFAVNFEDRKKRPDILFSLLSDELSGRNFRFGDEYEGTYRAQILGCNMNVSEAGILVNMKSDQNSIIFDDNFWQRRLEKLKEK